MLRTLLTRLLFWFCGPALPPVVEVESRHPGERRWRVRGRESEVPPASLFVRLGDPHPAYPWLTCKRIVWHRHGETEFWEVVADFERVPDGPALT